MHYWTVNGQSVISVFISPDTYRAQSKEERQSHYFHFCHDLDSIETGNELASNRPLLFHQSADVHEYSK